MFTQRHFIEMARAIAAMDKAHRTAAATAMADMSAATSPKFDRARFFKACNVVSIQDAASDLHKLLSNEFKPGVFSVGIADDTIMVFEHERGLAKRRMANHVYEGFPVKHKYVGKIKAA